MLILLSEANIAMWWFPWIAHFFEFRVLCIFNIVGSPICIKLFRCKLLPNSNNQKTTYIVPKMEKAGCCENEKGVVAQKRDWQKGEDRLDSIAISLNNKWQITNNEHVCVRQAGQHYLLTKMTIFVETSRRLIFDVLLWNECLVSMSGV